jgi:peptidoglycan hydrolase-like protein with peptidoglycan-binding domain
MAYSLIWLPHVLQSAGLKVAPVDGWQDRGRSEMGPVYGVICHHTATKRAGNMPSLKTLIDGRQDLSGPLCQLGLGRDGTFYVIAAGRANHAGVGVWKGLTNGNANFIGIEAENEGTADEFPWPAVQIEAYSRGVAAILKYIGRTEEYCAGHKEYARPLNRKPDPSFNMDEFRRTVGGILSGTIPAPSLIPAVEPIPVTGNLPRATLRRGSTGDLVKVAQRKLQLNEDGIFGAKTEAAIRVFQREKGAVPDGIVGPVTWKLLDAIFV